MNIYYQGKDITNFVQTRKCIVRDTAGERCDSLEIEFENAAGWYSWGPEEDDQIIVAENGYDSGVMYVNMILPEEGKYKIFATSLPCKARAKGTKSFSGKTLEEIMRICAVSSNMDYKLVGVDGDTEIPYIEQDNEIAAAFLDRLLTMESAVLKCIDGKYTAIGIEYAQSLPAYQTLEVYAKQSGILYMRSGQTYRSLTIKTPYAIATATDELVDVSHAKMVISGSIPALNNVQAARWARGKLLHINQSHETVRLESRLNVSFTAMMRVDVTGDTDATGEWIVAEAEHNFVNKTTTVTMHRCITSIC